MNYRLPHLFLRTLIFFHPLLTSANTLEVQPSTLSDQKVIYAEFGLFNAEPSNNLVFQPTNKIPLIPNQGYGWIIKLHTTKPTIKWREEFTLPLEPKTWGTPELLGVRSISSDSRTSTTVREVSPDDGVIFNAWEVAPGDPIGHYTIRVFIENTLIKTFEFDVQ